jgi:hypothetical protein
MINEIYKSNKKQKLKDLELKPLAKIDLKLMIWVFKKYLNRCSFKYCLAFF